MTTPGPVVTDADLRNPTGPQLLLSTNFLVGELTRGPDTPDPLTPVRSLDDLQAVYGDRIAATAAMHDWVDGNLHEGGSVAYVVPLRGPGAAQASHVFLDSAAATALTAKAKTKGSDGNRTAIKIDVSGGTYDVRVFRDGVQVEAALALADGLAAQTWSAGSKWCTLTDGPGGNPVLTASPAAFTGGLDDFANISNNEIAAALARFGAHLGTGNVVLPGRTGTSQQLLAQAHALATNRIARLDGADTGDVDALIALAATLRADANADRGDYFVPRLTMPGLAQGTVRTVEASVVALGAEARNDQAGISPNQPAAGEWGKAQYVTGVTREFTFAERGRLNDAGITVVRYVDGEIKVYGSRTLADPNTKAVAIRRGSARLRMAIHEIARYRTQLANFEELDQGGVALGELASQIRADINRYQRSLYKLGVVATLVAGDTPGTAAVKVDVTFQAAFDAEVIKTRIIRENTEL